MDFNSPKFKALRKKWYGKLAKSGFEDVEQDDVHLIRTEYRAMITNAAEIRAEYYRYCRHMLNDWRFKNAYEKKVFALHSEGVTVREIARITKKHTFDGVAKIIRRIKKEMKFGAKGE